MCWDYDDPNDFDPMVTDCDHDEYEVDILTGRATCCYCDFTWYQTKEEVEAERRGQQAWDDYIATIKAEPEVPPRLIRDDEIPF